MAESPLKRFALVLQLEGWTAGSPGGLRKGDWRIFFDTSSWVVLQTGSRTFDVAVPDGYRSWWTVNLIEDLARIEDERGRLRAALAAIRDDPDAGQSALSTARAALADCYHVWSADGPGQEVCPICGARRAQPSALTVAVEAIATVRSKLWAVTRDDVREALTDRLDQAHTDLSEDPQRAAGELLAFRQELRTNPHGAIPEPAAEAMERFANLAIARLQAEC